MAAANPTSVAASCWRSAAAWASCARTWSAVSGASWSLIGPAAGGFAGRVVGVVGRVVLDVVRLGVRGGVDLGRSVVDGEGWDVVVVRVGVLDGFVVDVFVGVLVGVLVDGVPVLVDGVAVPV